MQVKKFEAPTMQEALEHVKKELGPEAIILQTKKNKKGFGLLSKASVEITAAISERSYTKKQTAETRLPESVREKMAKFSAKTQADVLDRVEDDFVKQSQRIQESVKLSHPTRTAAAKATAAHSGAGDRSIKSGQGAPSSRGHDLRTEGSGPGRSAIGGLGSFVHGVGQKLWGMAEGKDEELSPPVAFQSGRPLTATRYADIPEAGLLQAGADQYAGPAPGDALRAQMNERPRGSLGSGAQSMVGERAERVGPDSAGSRGGQRAQQDNERTHGHLEVQLENLKQELAELKNAGPQSGGASAQASEVGIQALMAQPGGLTTPALQAGFEQLVISGVEKRLAYQVCRQAAFELGPQGSQDEIAVIDQIAVEMLEQIQVHEPLSAKAEAAKGPLLMALVGPTGVGKTTTVAKIASDALLKKSLKVALINFDTYKVGAFDQLATYAKILRVPFRSASTPEDLQAAIQDFQGMDLVLIDTAGRSCRDLVSLQEMEKVLHGIPGIHTHLVLSVTTRDSELAEMSSKFGIFRPEGLIFSKLDEASGYGAIYNVSMRSKLPLSYFTTGQRVPEDFEAASGERLVSLLLELED